MTEPLIEKLRSKTMYPESGCWIWTGLLNRPGGYGRVSVGGGRMGLAHRVAYELLVGPVPEGKQLDHLCRQRACWNPEHLEVVTGRVNTLRGEGRTAVNAAKTHCVNGHPFDGDNLYVDPSGKRTCRECRREVAQRRRERATELLATSDAPHGGSYRYWMGCRCDECRAGNTQRKREHRARVQTPGGTP